VCKDVQDAFAHNDDRSSYVVEALPVYHGLASHCVILVVEEWCNKVGEGDYFGGVRAGGEAPVANEEGDATHPEGCGRRVGPSPTSLSRTEEEEERKEGKFVDAALAVGLVTHRPVEVEQECQRGSLKVGGRWILTRLGHELESEAKNDVTH